MHVCVVLSFYPDLPQQGPKDSVDINFVSFNCIFCSIFAEIVVKAWLLTTLFTKDMSVVYKQLITH